jgi:hypothetical protein
MMDKIIPWSAWIAMIEPFYPNDHRGRPPIGIEKMLRMYLLQLWFNLSDEGVEDAIYDSYALRKFSHVDFLKEQVPDATTLLKFRHLLETNGIGKKIFEDINHSLYGDSGYLGLEKRSEIKEDSNFSSMEYHISRRPSSIRMPATYEGINWDKQIDKRKSDMRLPDQRPITKRTSARSTCADGPDSHAELPDQSRRLSGFCKMLIFCRKAGL